MARIDHAGIAAFLVTMLSMTFSSAHAADGEGEAIFEQRCSACHKLPDPDAPPEVGWAAQLEIMAPLARLKDDQKQTLLNFLQSHAQSSVKVAALEEDQQLFEQKCSLCHTLDRVLLEPLGGDDLQHVVSRMQNKSGTEWISDEDASRILKYVSQLPHDAAPDASLATDSSPEQIFDTRCSACHTLERIFSRLNEGEDLSEFWSHTVSRMRGKAPQWMSEDDASKILSYLQSTLPERLQPPGNSGESM